MKNLNFGLLQPCLVPMFLDVVAILCIKIFNIISLFARNKNHVHQKVCGDNSLWNFDPISLVCFG